ncbi:DMT family transporter [Helicobacter himalayensis]|uniref:DMT family transporter n=1 Tax=Helicobacter himalayensis TaxID=1591088 RepID=UPI003D6DB64E
MRQYSSISIGIFCMLASSFFFALMNACVKILSANLSAVEIIFFRSFVMVLLLLAFFAYKPPKKTHKKGGWGILALRSLFGGLSMLAFFYNIAHIPLGVASTFMQTSPLFIVVISLLFLKENIKIGVLFMSVIGFGGIVLICDPHFHSISLLNILLGLFSGLGTALAFISLRGLRGYFDGNIIVLSFGVVMSVVSLILVFLQPFIFPQSQALWIMPNTKEWLWILIMGLVGTFGQYFLTQAYILAPAGIVAPIDYTRVVFSLILGVLLGDLLPNITTFFGIILIIFSGIAISLPVLLKDLKTLKTT